MTWCTLRGFGDIRCRIDLQRLLVVHIGPKYALSRLIRVEACRCIQGILGTMWMGLLTRYPNLLDTLGISLCAPTLFVCENLEFPIVDGLFIGMAGPPSDSLTYMAVVDSAGCEEVGVDCICLVGQCGSI